MKVGIDLTSLLYRRGVGRYTSNLFTALSQDPQVQLYPYASSHRGQKKLLQELDRLQGTLTPGRKKVFQKNLVVQKYPPRANWIFWHYLGTNPVRRALPSIDVFHSWDYLQPPDKDLPLVSTIHDLAILKFPHLANNEIVTHHRESWRILKDRRAQVIVVSEHTRDDVINLLGFDEDHVHLVYEALPRDTTLEKSELTVARGIKIRQKYTLNKNYILFVGTREPRKNLERLIEAWWPLREEIDLVLVGASGWNEPKLKHPNLKIISGIVDDYDLGLLYYCARMLAYPSLEEGFGLPILEAFAYQTPVLTSLNTATAEVAGKAGVLVDPYSVNKINEGMRKILGENKAQKKARRDKMKRQLNKFSWKKAAEETKAVYQRAIEEKNA